MKKILTSIFICLFLAISNIAFGASENNNYYTAGREAYTAGNYILAQKYFLALLNQNPSNINARYYLGHSLAKQGKYNEASVEYKRIIDSNPNSQTARYAQISLNAINPYLSQAAQKAVTSNDSSGNYFINALSSGTMLIRWQSMPISVYIPQGEYYPTVKSAFTTWENGLRGIVKFQYVTSPKISQIEIKFDNKLESTKTEKNYLSGVTQPFYKGNALIKAEITLLIINPNSQQPQSKKIVYSTALHEIGHALGIRGHSQNSNDVMYASGNGYTQTISLRDYNTVKMLYSMSGNELSSYADKVYNAKLSEALNYIKIYPDKAIGYLNLADLYRNNNKINEAIAMYNKALTLDKNQAAGYYFLGECYFKQKNYALALNYYQQALKHAPTNKYYLNTFARACIATNNKALGQKYLNAYLKQSPSSNDPIVTETINLLK